MANTDNPEEIISSTQRATINSIKDLVTDFEKYTKFTGLTWSQIHHVLDNFLDKKPTIINQEGPMNDR